jgi:hypothetical protein
MHPIASTLIGGAGFLPKAEKAKPRRIKVS